MLVLYHFSATKYVWDLFLDCWYKVWTWVFRLVWNRFNNLEGTGHCLHNSDELTLWSTLGTISIEAIHKPWEQILGYFDPSQIRGYIYLPYKKGAKISWLQDFLQILSRKIGETGWEKFARNLATTNFRSFPI